MKSSLKIRTSFVSPLNLETLTKEGWLPIFILRSIQNSTLIGKYSGTPVHFYWLAPKPNLFHEWRDGKIDFDKYSERYSKEILENIRFDSLISRMEILCSTSGAKGIVMLGYGSDYKNCHRSILSQLLNSTGLLEDRVIELVV